MIPRIGVEGYKYEKCLAQSWLEPIRGSGAPSLWLAPVNFKPNISRIYTPPLQSWVSLLRSTPMKMERIKSSETSALKAQTPGGYPKKTHNTAFTHGEILKSRRLKSQQPHINGDVSYGPCCLECDTVSMGERFRRFEGSVAPFIFMVVLYKRNIILWLLYSKRKGTTIYRNVGKTHTVTERSI